MRNFNQDKSIISESSSSRDEYNDQFGRKNLSRHIQVTVEKAKDNAYLAYFISMGYTALGSITVSKLRRHEGLVN